MLVSTCSDVPTDDCLTTLGQEAQTVLKYPFF